MEKLAKNAFSSFLLYFLEVFLNFLRRFCPKRLFPKIFGLKVDLCKKIVALIKIMTVFTTFSSVPQKISIFEHTFFATSVKTASDRDNCNIPIELRPPCSEKENGYGPKGLETTFIDYSECKEEFVLDTGSCLV